MHTSTATMNDTKILGQKGYQLKETLGKGSYSKVKSAYCSRLKHLVAIKIIDKTKASQDLQKRFIPRELEALTCLQHPSIIKIHEIFDTSFGKVYIVMELGKKGNLLDYIRTRGAMEEDVARVKFLQLASAVKHCHDLDFAHRDLKCENIILDEDLNTKLADFGFSKRLSRDESGKTILSNTYCGTAAYAAPEVLEGVPYDPRISDIWSLGVILYIMVYALMPFDDSSVRKMIRCQKQRKFTFPESKYLTAECKDLIYRLLQPNVTQRMHIDEVLKHAWLQTPRSTAPSHLPAAEEGECSQNLREKRPTDKQQAKSHSAKGKGKERK